MAFLFIPNVRIKGIFEGVPQTIDEHCANPPVPKDEQARPSRSSVYLETDNIIVP